MLRVVLLVSLLALALAGRDYYRILGVKRRATEQQLKRAYRKLGEWATVYALAPKSATTDSRPQNLVVVVALMIPTSS